MSDTLCRGRNGLHQLGQPVAPSILFPVFNPEGEPGTLSYVRSQEGEERRLMTGRNQNTERERGSEEDWSGTTLLL